MLLVFLSLSPEIKEAETKEREKTERERSPYPALLAIRDSWRDPSPAGDLVGFPI